MFEVGGEASHAAPLACGNTVHALARCRPLARTLLSVVPALPLCVPSTTRMPCCMAVGSTRLVWWMSARSR